MEFINIFIIILISFNYPITIVAFLTFFNSLIVIKKKKTMIRLCSHSHSYRIKNKIKLNLIQF